MKHFFIIISCIILFSLFTIASFSFYQLNIEKRLLNTQQMLRLFNDKTNHFIVTIDRYLDEILSIKNKANENINKNIQSIYSEINNFKNILKIDNVYKGCFYCHKEKDLNLFNLKESFNTITKLASNLHTELILYVSGKNNIDKITEIKNKLKDENNTFIKSLHNMENHLNEEISNKMEILHKLGLALTGIFIIVNFFLVLFFYRRVIKDIDSLTNLSKTIFDEKKAVNIDLKKFQNQEIREFVSLLNTAISKLRKKEKELQEQMEEISSMNEELQASNQQMELLTFELEETRENLENIVKEKTKELQKAYQELQELDTLKSNFLHSISHEFKTPLTPLFGYLKLFKNKDLGELTPLQEQSIDIMLTCAEKLYNTIEDIILLARLDVEKEKYILKEVDLAYLLKTTISRVEKELSEKKITLIQDIPNISIVIHGDQLMLIQTFLHILRNAIKFTPEKGTIRVILSLEEKDAVVRVIDSGPGIPEKTINEINDYLTSKNIYTNKKGDAITIGLNLMKRVIIINNASIQYKSEKGKGTEVIITFPTQR